jgi:hypothetical protein
MITEMLKHTPTWVFVLFLVLLAAGYLQSKTRAVNRNVIALLPITMLALSFYGVLSAFGASPLSIIAWLIGVAAAVELGVKIGMPRGVSFAMETELFSVPGSWLPLILMMTIFLTKYTVNVMLARQLPMVTELLFVEIISFWYGLLSGLFLARGLVIWRARKATSSAGV